MPAIEIETGVMVPSTVPEVPYAAYTRVTVAGHRPVLVRRVQMADTPTWFWSCDGNVGLSPTQHDAVCDALGVELPNWRVR